LARKIKIKIKRCVFVFLLPQVLEDAHVVCINGGSITLEKPSIAPGWHFELG
jgi:hypothetical protein